ncbi:hypothetical protein E4T39_05777 [Aureobasidium subglaciale]|nr:hypothetical protein E4T39_05777 [Aureobasidium subglaciale]
MPRSTRSSAAAAAAAAATPKKTKVITSKPTKSIKPRKKAIKREPEPEPSTESSDDESDQNEPYTAVLTSKLDRIVRKIRCTIGNGTIATLDKKQNFTQTIELTSKKPFSFEPVLMESGPYAGRHVLVLQPEPDEHEIFPFLKLPAEIRNMIYSLVLERPGYRIRFYGKHSGVINTMWLRDDGSWLPTSKNPYSSSLMRVNKQINVESTPYLFSRHTFEFSDSTMLQRFLEYIGPERVQSLVAVSVKRQFRTSLKKAYQLLSPAVCLTKLKLSSWYCYHYHLQYAWSDALLPLIQALCADGGRSREDIINIISIPGAIRGTCGEHGMFTSKMLGDCKKEQKAYKKFYRELREEICKALDQAEVKKQAIKSGAPVKTRAGRKTKAIDYSGMCSDEDGED